VRENSFQKIVNSATVPDQNQGKGIEKAPEKDTTVTNPDYDATMAKRLGSDDYGMKSFILVILKTGPNQTTDMTFINNCFRGHFENMNRMVKEGKLIVAGPIGKNNNSYRGIFILNLTSVEEAERLLQTDPAIKEGLLEEELYNWYGSAALPEYLKYAEKIWKNKPN
jgi:uncharacterized protein YciI